MADIVRINRGLQRVVDSDEQQYESFRRGKFKVIDGLPVGKYVEFVIEEPTLIKQSTGEIKVTSLAPTIILGGTGRITLDAYAQVAIDGSTGALNAHLRENSYIRGCTGDVDVTAAGHLEFFAQSVRSFNGIYNRWGSVHVNAPNGNAGFIKLIGGTGNINFQYDNRARFEISDDSQKSLLQRVKELL